MTDEPVPEYPIFEDLGQALAHSWPCFWVTPCGFYLIPLDRGRALYTVDNAGGDVLRLPRYTLCACWNRQLAHDDMRYLLNVEAERVLLALQDIEHEPLVWLTPGVVSDRARVPYFAYFAVAMADSVHRKRIPREPYTVPDRFWFRCRTDDELLPAESGPYRDVPR